MNHSYNYTELVDRYLSNEMSVEEMKNFEQELNKNADLKAELQFQQNIKRAASKLGIQADIDKAGVKFKKIQLLKTLSFIVLGVIFLAVIAYLSMSKKQISEQTKTINSTIEISQISELEDNKSEVHQNEIIKKKLFNSLKKKTQVFEFDVKNGKTIIGNENTVLEIPAKAFVDSVTNEPVFGKVNFKLKEFYTMKDFILNGLTTLSNGKPLESGGMIFTEATQNGRKLKLAIGKSITVKMPNKVNKKGMNLFYGEFTKDKKLNWVDTKIPFEYINMTNKDEEGIKDNFSNQVTVVAIDLEIPPTIPAKVIDCNAKIKPFAYPPQALRKKIKGKVNITFSVDENGNLSDFKNLSGNLGYGIEDSIYLAIKNTGKWRPGIVFGEEMFTVNNNLVFTFSINKGDAQIIYPKLKCVNPEDDDEMIFNGYKKRIESSQNGQDMPFDKLNETRKTYNAYNTKSKNQNRLVTSISKLGWANCDRFWNVPEKCNVYIADDSLTSFIVVENSSSLLESNFINSLDVSYSGFQSIPSGQYATAVSFIEINDNFKICTKQFKIIPDVLVEMDDYKVVNKEEFEKIISSIK